MSKLSKESYKERKANNGQTLTGLGKWWGRKPLVLVRAAIIGSLMPATDNPKRDMDIFLKVMSMDEAGLWKRKEKPISASELMSIASQNKSLSRHIGEWFDESGGRLKLRKGVDRQSVEQKVFAALGYDEKLVYCIRPEQLQELGMHTWNEINEHLGTKAYSLTELIKQLAIKRFGANAVIGDCFCGGGSIPFEAARLGCETYASDLNPVAGLLTWAGINICGSSEEEIKSILAFQQRVYFEVDDEITNLGIEHNEQGDRAVSYLYCIEAHCPECGIKVPLAPSWIIGKGTNSVAKLTKIDNAFLIDVKMNATRQEMKEAEDSGTVSSKGLVCPSCNKATPITALRRDRKGENGEAVYGLRMWEKQEFEFRHDDVYSERLYAIKYERVDGSRYYRSPNELDLRNEEKVRQIVASNIEKWQSEGIVPSMKIEGGLETERLYRERGWTHWNHLFNPRQILLLSRLCEKVFEEKDLKLKAAGLLGLNKCVDWNSRLCRWNSGVGNEKAEQTFYNQALNTLMNWGTRSSIGMKPSWLFDINKYHTNLNSKISVIDAKDISQHCHIWITDPPYADAVNYHELSEFFLAWDKRLLQEIFPDWYTDSKRILAIKGDNHFAQSMIDIYSNLTRNMPDDGLQIVMFTHSDPAVWAQLALIMWKSGLKVTAAWNIATETESAGLKDGNYVKGTVLLVLRKQTGFEEAFLDEIGTDIRSEVRYQIQSMQELESKEDPNFSDPDYVLAAYAASLKVLTSFKSIGEIDLDYELSLAIHDPTKSKVVDLIERAKRTAYDYIIPQGFDRYIWKDLSMPERFYIKGLESEKNGNYQISTFQEYARGFAISSYGQLMANEKANTCRLKTPMEFAMRNISDIPNFEGSMLRIIFASIYTAVKEDENPQKGLSFIKNNVADYWGSRDTIKILLEFIIDTKNIGNMHHWKESAQMAEHIFVLVDNDHV